MWFRKGRRKVVTKKFTPKRRRSWIWKVQIVLFIIVIGIGSYFLLTNSLFNVSSLSVTTKQVDCTSEGDIKNSSQILGKNIFLLDRNKIENNLKDKYFCVNNINLGVALPNSIKMSVFGRTAAYQLLVFSEKEASATAVLDNFLNKDSTESAQEDLSVPTKYVVDNEGVVFAKAEVNNLPNISLYKDNVKTGEKLDPKIFENYLNIVKQMMVLGVAPGDTKIYSDSYLLIDTKPKLIFDLGGNINKQLGALQLILSRAKIDNSEMEFVDLRFENPVVKYIPKEKNNG